MVNGIPVQLRGYTPSNAGNAHMPRIKAKLTDTQIKNFKPADKPYKKADDGGLSILVRPTGTKVWQYRYILHGKVSSNFLPAHHVGIWDIFL